MTIVSEEYVLITQHIPDKKLFYNLFVLKTGNEADFQVLRKDLLRLDNFYVHSSLFTADEVDTLMKFKRMFYSVYDWHWYKVKGTLRIVIIDQLSVDLGKLNWISGFDKYIRLHAAYEAIKPFLDLASVNTLFVPFGARVDRDEIDTGFESIYVRFVNTEDQIGYAYYVRLDGNKNEINVLLGDLKRLKAKGMCGNLVIAPNIHYTESEVDEDIARNPKHGRKLAMKLCYTDRVDRIMKEYREDYVYDAVSCGRLRDFVEASAE